MGFWINAPIFLLFSASAHAFIPSTFEFFKDNSHARGMHPGCERLIMDQTAKIIDPNLPEMTDPLIDKLLEQDQNQSYGRLLALGRKADELENSGRLKELAAIKTEMHLIIKENMQRWFPKFVWDYSGQVIFGTNGRIRGLKFGSIHSFLHFFEHKTGRASLELFMKLKMDSIEIHLNADSSIKEDLERLTEYLAALAEHGNLRNVEFQNSPSVNYAFNGVRAYTMVESLRKYPALLAKLDHLGLNSFNFAKIANFKDILDGLSRVSSLSLENTALPADSLEKIVARRSIEHLSLSNIAINSGSNGTIAEAISKMTQLKTLNISNLLFSNAELKLIATLPKLVSLNFAPYNEFSIIPSGFEVAPAADRERLGILAAGLPSLKRIHLGTMGWRYGADHNEKIKGSKELKTLIDPLLKRKEILVIRFTHKMPKLPRGAGREDLLIDHGRD